MTKTYSGFTSGTAEKLLLDAGAFFKNFIVGTDTFDSAVAAGKLLGATQGGGSFSAIPTMRKIEIDGIKGSAKGMQVIDEWVITLTANMKEISKDVIKAALASGNIADASSGYNKITANNYVVAADYIDNITWVGKISGADTPVIIQVENALSTSGLTVNAADKAEAVVSLTFTGHYDAADLDSPPFGIYYPEEAVTKGSISGVVSDAMEAAVASAKVSVVVNGYAILATTNASGVYSLVNVPEGTYTVTAYKDAMTGLVTDVAVVAGEDTADTDITIA